MSNSLCGYSEPPPQRTVTRSDKFGTKELDWPAQKRRPQPCLTPLGGIRDADFEPGPLVQHQHLTSHMLFWLNEHEVPLMHSIL